MDTFKIWIEDFKKAECEPMGDVGEIFFRCSLNEMYGYEFPKDVQPPFLYELIKKRCEFVRLKSTPWACLFLAALAKRPGTAVMYIYYLKAIECDLTMDNLAKVFPIGFPKESELEILWDLQKTKDHQNMLDSMELHEWLCNRE